MIVRQAAGYKIESSLKMWSRRLKDNKRGKAGQFLPEFLKVHLFAEQLLEAGFPGLEHVMLQPHYPWGPGDSQLLHRGEENVFLPLVVLIAINKVVRNGP